MGKAEDGAPGGPSGRSPLTMLDEADQEFVVRLVLSSGSLKDLARAYGVSYPTIRSRLDRLQERLRAILAGRKPDRMADLLAGLVERGEITVPAARAVRDLHRAMIRDDGEA